MENRDSWMQVLTASFAGLLFGGGLILSHGGANVHAEEAIHAAGDANHSAEDIERLFTLKVMPLLTEKCLGCHGTDADDIKGDYDVRTRDALLRGGESEEAAIIPGNAEDSPFFWAVNWDGLGNATQRKRPAERKANRNRSHVDRRRGSMAKRRTPKRNSRRRVDGRGERRRRADGDQWRSRR